MAKEKEQTNSLQLQDGVPALNRRQAAQLVLLLNFYSRRLPRLVGTMLSSLVETSVEEIQSGLYDDDDGPLLFGETRGGVRFPDFARYDPNGVSGMTVVNLLTAICEPDVRITATWVEGRIHLMVEH